jgi:hypothetical protein
MIVLKSGSLNFLEPSGPVKVCNGIALSLPLLYYGHQQASANVKIKPYRTMILPVVLYGCETWSLTLREERMLRAFENRVLGRFYNGTHRVPLQIAE